MRVYQVVAAAVVVGTAVPVALHHAVHGVVNAHQLALAFFLWLNAIIAAWEICLFLRIRLIEEQYERFRVQYRGRELSRVKDFFGARISLAGIFSPSTWAEIWSSYSIFDPSYADRRSFGFFVDVGNGFSTLVPSLVCLYGMTFDLLPARALGVVLLLACYQMLYGTVVYLGSFVMNRRYAGHTLGNLLVFVGLSNGIWLTFPAWGIWAALRLVYDDSYAVFVGG